MSEVVGREEIFMANQAAPKRLEEECEQYWSVLSTFCIIQEALPTKL